MMKSVIGDLPGRTAGHSRSGQKLSQGNHQSLAQATISQAGIENPSLSWSGDGRKTSSVDADVHVAPARTERA